MKKLILGLLVTWTMLFASNYPLGLSETEWTALPADKKVEYIKAQEMMNEMTMNQKQIENSKIKGKYREKVVVSTSGGRYKGYKEDYTVEPFSVSLNKGETVKSTIRMKKSNGFYTTRDCYVSLNGTANNVTISLSKPYGNKIKGTSFSNDGTWNTGKDYTVNIIDGRKELRGITVSIRYDDSLRNAQVVEIYNYDVLKK